MLCVHYKNIIAQFAEYRTAHRLTHVLCRKSHIDSNNMFHTYWYRSATDCMKMLRVQPLDYGGAPVEGVGKDRETDDVLQKAEEECNRGIMSCNSKSMHDQMIRLVGTMRNEKSDQSIGLLTSLHTYLSNIRLRTISKEDLAAPHCYPMRNLYPGNKKVNDLGKGTGFPSNERGTTDPVNIIQCSVTRKDTPFLHVPKCLVYCTFRPDTASV